ncbi:hypothetical protein [Paracoccus methylarcula]|uniref:hypothetical protein n=1 Tax=Paracoccus methylarcula TaxID=72022 RepID=UPI001B86A1EF|nr:hypothetical protein [Paracoccus methylarcula]
MQDVTAATDPVVISISHSHQFGGSGRANHAEIPSARHTGTQGDNPARLAAAGRD